MGQVTERLIAQLEAGGSGARDCLLEVSELLRKAWHPGFTPVFEHLVAENISQEETLRLREALAAYCARELSAPDRRRGLVTLAREGQPKLVKELVPELHLVLEAHRVLSNELFQLLLALENVGEKVYPDGVSSRSLDKVQANADAASAYLLARGIAVPY
jgi:hypothetical protein